MNEYFSNITESLDIDKIPETIDIDDSLVPSASCLSDMTSPVCQEGGKGAREEVDINIDNDDSNNTSDSNVEVIAKRFRNHPSIKRIIRMKSGNEEMNFHAIQQDEMIKQIEQLKDRKATPSDDIPANILKEFLPCYATIAMDSFNNAIGSSSFPDTLVNANITPLHKKDSKYMKENYRPISKLPNFSKVFERIIYQQIESFMANKFSPLLSGFRKGHSTHQALLHMIDKWHKSLDNGRIVGSVLMDLSKAFDCINHDLLIAKLHAYGFSVSASTLILSYLKGRHQRVEIEQSYSSWRILFWDHFHLISSPTTCFSHCLSKRKYLQLRGRQHNLQ